MITNNNLTNSFSDMRLSETQQENREKNEWMEHTQYERTLCKEEKLENNYDKFTQKKETVTTDIQQTILGTDNNKDMSTFGRCNIDRIGYSLPYRAIQTLSKWSLPYPKTNDYGTKHTNPCTSSGLPNNLGNLASYTDNAYGGPRETGKNQYGLTSGGGTTGGGKRVKEADQYDIDISQRSPFLPTEIKKKFGSAAKDISQSVISDFATESLCAIIDSSREKGLQNTDISKILTNTLCSSMQTLKVECSKEATSLFLECLPMAVTQLKYVKGPLQTVFFLFEIRSKIKDFLEGRLTLWQIVEWLLSKAVSLGILYFIACMFGPLGCVSATAITVAINVTTHLFKRVVLPY